MPKEIEDVVARYGDYAVDFKFYEGSVTLTIKEIYESFRERIRKEEQPAGAADVISKTRQGVTVHYAIGPVRATREEAEQDLRLFQER